MKVSKRRQRFLQESLKLIHEKGFNATSMRDIAEHMQFEVANIYNYIESKQSLLETFLFGISNEFHEGILSIIEAKLRPKEKLSALIDLHIRLTASKPYEVALLVNEWRHLQEPRLSEFIKEREIYEDYVRQIIKAGMDNGDIRKMDLDIANHMVLSSVRWLYSWYTSHSHPIDPKMLEQQITAFIWRGLAQNPLDE